MTIDLASLEDAARAWLLAASGLPDERVIFSHQDGQDPGGGAYMVIEVWESGDTLGMYPEQGVNSSGQGTQTEHWRVEGTVSVHGPGARHALITAKSRSLLPSYYARIHDLGIDGELDGEIAHIPENKARGWEEQAQIGLILRLRTGTIDTGAPDPEGTPAPLAWFDRATYSGPDMAPRPIPPTTITHPETEE
jgi:hypothetical protein